MKDLMQKNILRKLVNKLSRYEYVIGIILYGSFARRDFGRKSDVDVFILVDNEDYVENINDATIEIDSKRPFQPVIRSFESLKKTDPTLLQNIFKEGRIVYWKHYVDLDAKELLKLKPYILYNFKLLKMRQTTKAKFNYILYGKKKNGLIYKMNGSFISKSCILIPDEYKKEIEKLFKRYNITYNYRNVWM